MFPRNLFSAFALALLAGKTAALSIGNAQGTVILGRPLDVAFAVASDGKPLEDACVRAAVFAGDSAISPAQVRVALGTGSAGREAVIRVQTAQPVTEPVITVRITAGCNGSVVRNFTLLSYPPSTSSANEAGSASLVPSLTAIAAKPPVRAQNFEQTTTATSNANREAAPTDARRNGVSARKSATKASTIPAAEPTKIPKTRLTRAIGAGAPESIAQSQPRLVMEPLSDWLDAPATLQYSFEIGKIPAEEPSADRTAAASLWRALNMPADEVAQTLARTSEQDVQLAQAQSDKKVALEAQARLNDEIAQSFPAKVVYSLLLALALLAALVAWLWSRGRRQAHLERLAWTHAVASNSAEPVMVAATEPSSQASVAARAGHDHGAGRLAPTEPDLLPSGIVPLEFGVGNAERVEHAALPEPADASPIIPKPIAHAVVNPEELFDLQQQAEFFVSVGEHGQAIQVLRQHIETNQATSPLAYLELLRLYRSLSRFDDYNNLRAQLHLYFNAQVPEFNAFTRLGRNLAGYPEELARIEALWADASVVALLKEMLFRDSAQEHQRFELAAYDDLLLLHAIASTTPATARGDSTGRFRTTPHEAELPNNTAPETSAQSMPAAASLIDFEPDWDFAPSISHPTSPAHGEPSARVELDLDLSEFAFIDELQEVANSTGPLPFLTEDEVPPVPPKDQLPPNQPIGFGANSDRFEARIDPEVRKP